MAYLLPAGSIAANSLQFPVCETEASPVGFATSLLADFTPDRALSIIVEPLPDVVEESGPAPLRSLLGRGLLPVPAQGNLAPQHRETEQGFESSLDPRQLPCRYPFAQISISHGTLEECADLTSGEWNASPPAAWSKLQADTNPLLSERPPSEPQDQFEVVPLWHGEQLPYSDAVAWIDAQPARPVWSVAKSGLISHQPSAIFPETSTHAVLGLWSAQPVSVMSGVGHEPYEMARQEPVALDSEIAIPVDDASLPGLVPTAAPAFLEPRGIDSTIRSTLSLAPQELVFAVANPDAPAAKPLRVSFASTIGQMTATAAPQEATAPQEMSRRHSIQLESKALIPTAGGASPILLPMSASAFLEPRGTTEGEVPRTLSLGPREFTFTTASPLPFVPVQLTLNVRRASPFLEPHGVALTRAQAISEPREMIAEARIPTRLIELGAELAVCSTKIRAFQSQPAAACVWKGSSREPQTWTWDIRQPEWQAVAETKLLGTAGRLEQSWSAAHPVTGRFVRVEFLELEGQIQLPVLRIGESAEPYRGDRFTLSLSPQLIVPRGMFSELGREIHPDRRRRFRPTSLNAGAADPHRFLAVSRIHIPGPEFRSSTVSDLKVATALVPWQEVRLQDASRKVGSPMPLRPSVRAPRLM